MASRNVGGRPRNDWTPSRLRKLVRLHELSNTKVELIPEILKREDGFKPSLRDVHTKLTATLPKNTASSSRRRRKIRSRAELKNVCKQLKPRAGSSEMTLELKSIIAAQPTENLLDNAVVDDRWYNPLTHWDYFSGSETACVMLEQVLLASSDPVNQPLGSTLASESMAKDIESQRDIRKKKLRSVVACSELSFVVSLLSTRWSKSSLHTRVLSDTSSIGRRCDELWSMPTISATDNFEMRKLIFTNTYSWYAGSRILDISAGWRPCCGLRWYDSSRNCSMCGFSSHLYRARLIGHQKKHPMLQSQDNADTTATFVDLLDYVRADPVLSSKLDTEILETDSATVEFLEASIQSTLSDHFIEQERNSGETFTTEWSSDLMDCQDRFGNTALHHAAAAQNFDAVILLLNMGVTAELLNTTGQTFLHLLDPWRDMHRYMEVLRYLMDQSNTFPFLLRDNFGVSIAHNFSAWTKNSHHVPMELLSEVHSVLGHQNFGGSRGDFRGANLELDFTARFAVLARGDWASGDADLAIEIDKNGDTCLIAILKEWPEGGDMNTLLKLINNLTRDRELKTNINVYDIEGLTPLAIAVSRGMCAAVELLLDLGANPNARTYTNNRKSLLAWAADMEKAARKTGDDRLWAAIIECEKMLVLRGAVKEVKLSDEFGLDRLRPNSRASLGARS